MKKVLNVRIGILRLFKQLSSEIYNPSLTKSSILSLDSREGVVSFWALCTSDFKYAIRPTLLPL